MVIFDTERGVGGLYFSITSTFSAFSAQTTYSIEQPSNWSLNMLIGCMDLTILLRIFNLTFIYRLICVNSYTRGVSSCINYHKVLENKQLQSHSESEK